MNFVLIHIGNALPNYIYDTIEQLRKVFDGNLYFVKSKSIQMNDDFDITFVDYEDLLDYPKMQEFKNSNHLQGFWDVTCQRLFVLESMMSKYNLDSAFHIENDNTVYINPEELDVSKYVDSIAINPTGPAHSSAAFMYVDTLDALSFVNDKMLHLLQHKEIVQQRFSIDAVSEMNMLKLLQDDYPDVVKCFPILTEGEYATEDGIIFDCATWGQLLGGIPNGHRITAKELQHHWIGFEVYTCEEYEIIWEESDGLRVPILIDKYGDRYRINNLHIHCKRIREFM